MYSFTGKLKDTLLMYFFKTPKIKVNYAGFKKKNNSYSFTSYLVANFSRTSVGLKRSFFGRFRPDSGVSSEDVDSTTCMTVCLFEQARVINFRLTECSMHKNNAFFFFIICMIY